MPDGIMARDNWKANENAAKGLGDALAKAVAEVQSKQQDKSVGSALLSTLKPQKEKLPILEIGSHRKYIGYLVAGVGFEPTTFGL